jgi:hypothetical protein
MALRRMRWCHGANLRLVGNLGCTVLLKYSCSWWRVVGQGIGACQHQRVTKRAALGNGNGGAVHGVETEGSSNDYVVAGQTGEESLLY